MYAATLPRARAVFTQNDDDDASDVSWSMNRATLASNTSRSLGSAGSESHASSNQRSSASSRRAASAAASASSSAAYSGPQLSSRVSASSAEVDGSEENGEEQWEGESDIVQQADRNDAAPQSRSSKILRLNFAQPMFETVHKLLPPALSRQGVAAAAAAAATAAAATAAAAASVSRAAPAPSHPKPPRQQSHYFDLRNTSPAVSHNSSPVTSPAAPSQLFDDEATEELSVNGNQNAGELPSPLFDDEATEENSVDGNDNAGELEEDYSADALQFKAADLPLHDDAAPLPDGWEMLQDPSGFVYASLHFLH